MGCGYLLCTLGLKFVPSVFILLPELFQLWKLFQLAPFVCMFDILIILCVCLFAVCLCVFNTFTSGSTRYSMFLLCTFCPSIESAISTRRFSSFCRRMVLETRTWMFGVAIGVIASRSVSCQSEERDVNNYGIYVYTPSVNISIGNQPSLILRQT